MAEVLNIIFQNFWTYIGSVFLIFSIGYAISFPFYWYYKLKQIKLNKSIWQNHLN